MGILDMAARANRRASNAPPSAAQTASDYEQMLRRRQMSQIAQENAHLDQYGAGPDAPQYQAKTPSRLDRARAMIMSGNKTMQNHGFAELVAANNQANTAPADRRSTVEKQLEAMGFTLGTKAAKDMARKIVMKKSYQEMPTGYLTPEEKARGGLDQDSTYVWKGGVPTPIKSSSYTTEQIKSAGYAERMEGAEAAMQLLEEGGFDPTTMQQKIGHLVPHLGNMLLTGEGQMHKQLVGDWVRAKLRWESGAAIGKDEMADEIAIYFPNAGDGPLALAAKKRARLIAQRAMGAASGGKFTPKSQRKEGDPAVLQAEQEVRDALKKEQDARNSNDVEVDYGPDNIGWSVK